jgi:hypothetical protein
MRLRWLTVMAVVASAVGLGVAQQTPSDVAFAGEFFFRFRAAAGGLTPEARAGVVQERLTQVFTRLYDRGALPTVGVRHYGNWATIWVTGVLFATVTSNDARANGTTVRNLASQWSRNTARALRTILPTPKIARSLTRPFWLAQAR